MLRLAMLTVAGAHDAVVVVVTVRLIRLTTRRWAGRAAIRLRTIRLRTTFLAAGRAWAA
jgi:hypothetical protein